MNSRTCDRIRPPTEKELLEPLCLLSAADSCLSQPFKQRFTFLSGAFRRCTASLAAGADERFAAWLIVHSWSLLRCCATAAATTTTAAAAAAAAAAAELESRTC
eukprot:INCI12418.2.p1 GENE.INCI12418.2~~INCI12418.2.p1  ORF type:complete len:104 (+),score=18.82 INCI12418.2:274-585(+)